MTSYRDRLNAGVYDAKKSKAQSESKAKASEKKRAQRSTTTDKVKGLKA